MFLLPRSLHPAPRAPRTARPPPHVAGWMDHVPRFNFGQWNRKDRGAHLMEGGAGGAQPRRRKVYYTEKRRDVIHIGPKSAVVAANSSLSCGH